MNKVVKHKKFLSRCAANPSIVKRSTLEQISCLVEICHNLASIPLSSKEKRLLCKQLDNIRTIGRCSREKKARHELVQAGGSILPILIPAVLELFRHLV